MLLFPSLGGSNNFCTTNVIRPFRNEGHTLSRKQGQQSQEKADGPHRPPIKESRVADNGDLPAVGRRFGRRSLRLRDRHSWFSPTWCLGKLHDAALFSHSCSSG